MESNALSIDLCHRLTCRAVHRGFFPEVWGNLLRGLQIDAGRRLIPSEERDEVANAVIDILSGDGPVGSTPKQNRSLRRTLSYNLARTKSPGVARRAFTNLRSLSSSTILSPLAATAGIKEAIPQLLKWTTKGTGYERKAAIDALAKLGGDSHEDVLVELFTDSESQVQVAAADYILRVSKDADYRDRAREIVSRLLVTPTGSSKPMQSRRWKLQCQRQRLALWRWSSYPIVSG